MKTKLHLLLFLFGFVLSTELVAQQKDDGIYPMVEIKGYKNAFNKKVASKPIKAELIVDLPHIKLYRAYKHSTTSANTGGRFRTNVDISDTFWYCLRPGEEVASVVSWTFNTQVNKNYAFRKNGPKYFKDYGNLAQKIKDKEYKHDEIIEVVTMYNDWKSTQ